MSLSGKLNREIEKIEVHKITPISDEKISHIIENLSIIDQDLRPMLETFQRMMDEITDPNLKAYFFRRILKFYGFGNKDILSTRQKLVLVDKELVKKPFLKQKHMDSINILLEDEDII